MLNITTDTSFDDLKIFLEKLFQFENDDLDFGIYKILNYKKSEIQTFINNLLTEKVKEELNLLAGVESENLSVQLKELETDDVIIGYNKALTEKDETTINVLTSVSKTKIDQYKSLKKQAIHNQQTEKAEGHIYKHLALFFSRYYDKGDFISKRRYGKTEKYIIPYNGEETYFYWANADQYYIKSSEFFRKYSFRIPATDGYTIVNFKLKDANEEQGNTRSEENKYFIVADAPVEITDAEINIFFEYRAITDAEKTQKGNNQSKLNEHALPVIKKALGADTAIVSLFTETEGKTKLGNELNRYTSRNKYDFFIHKDLKGFLTRELDFYIKSELLKLDDLTVFDSETHFETIKLQFTIIKAFKKIAAIIIDFISQIEDFQKKLWEKKKFVIDTQYVITLDKLAAFTSVEFTDAIINEAIANAAQVKEWKVLFGEQILTDWDKIKTSDLKNNRNEYKKLPVDTRHFAEDFKWKLLCEISKKESLEEVSDGLVFQSDNYQALNLLEEKYHGNIKSVYIDPPYNTGSDRFLYKDGFKESTWLSMLNDRLKITLPLLKENATFFCSIDNDEIEYLHMLCNEVFGREHFVENFLWTKTSTPPSLRKKSRQTTEYVLCYQLPQDNKKFKGEKLSGGDQPLLNAGNATRELIFPRDKIIFTLSDGTYNAGEYDRVKLLEDITIENGKPDKNLRLEGEFKWTANTLLDELEKGTTFIVKSNKFAIRFIRIENDESYKAPTNLLKEKYYSPIVNKINSQVGTNETAKSELENLFGEEFIYEIELKFGRIYPKPSSLIAFLSNFSTENGDFILDYFSGSGTTAQSILNLNSKSEIKRKFILIEQGFYVNTLIIPRIKKLGYSLNWQNKIPKDENGQGVFFKYHRLEQYEESLENIAFSKIDTTQTQLAFNDYIPKYFLNFETADSDTFLNIDAMQNPFSYELKVFNDYEYVSKKVDLIETFNYLIGLFVKGYELKKEQNRDYIFVNGSDRQNKNMIVVWRNSLELDYEKDRDLIEQYLQDKPYDALYVNNQCIVEGAQMIEEVFKNKMN